jgi:alpha-ketoglutaric semialdehyde dehydrogenase
VSGYPELEQAASRAQEAFDAYRATGDAERAAFLDGVADRVEALGTALTDQVTAETHLPQARAASERDRTCAQLRMFARLVEDGSWRGVRVAPGDPGRTPLPRPDLRVRRVPIGPVAVFGASNFPLAFSVAGGDTAAALAAGAPVIVKAHEAHPRTSALVEAAVREAAAAQGLPEGVFAVLYGDGPGLGQALAAHPAVAAVAFTGSRAAGLAIAATAAARPRPIPVFAEMSSVNPVFVLPGALAARPAELARGLIGSVTLGAGQFCTNPGLVVVQDGPGLDAFLAAAAEAVAETRLHPMLTPGIAAAYRDGTARLAAVPGVETVAAGEGDPAAVLLRTGAAVFAAEPALHEEVFGAAALVVVTGGETETHRLVDRLEGQLTATVHAEPSDHAEAGRLLPRLESLAGRIVFDGWPTGVEVGPATVHGGPFPATTDARSTSVGTLAIDRFLRPVAYQDAPAALLPTETR